MVEASRGHIPIRHGSRLSTRAPKKSIRTQNAFSVVLFVHGVRDRFVGGSVVSSDEVVILTLASERFCAFRRIDSV